MNQEQQVTVRIQKSEEEPDPDEIDCICRTGSTLLLITIFCKVYLSL